MAAAEQRATADREARVVAEQARFAAEQQAVAERQARAAVEARLRELEAELRRPRDGSSA